MRQLTHETGQEHALVRMTSGEFQIQSGGQMGIDLSGDIDQVLAHTHPYGVDALGPSAGDLAMLDALKQSYSVLLEHGQTILFGPEGTLVWRSSSGAGVSADCVGGRSRWMMRSCCSPQGSSVRLSPASR